MPEARPVAEAERFCDVCRNSSFFLAAPKAYPRADVVPKFNAVLKCFYPLRYTLEVTVAPMPPSTNPGELPSAKR